MAHSKKQYLLAALILSCFAARAEAVFFADKFPQPGIVRDKVKFWQHVFYHYDSMATLVHDTHRVDLVLDVINFRAPRYQAPSSPRMSWAQRQREAHRYVKRYRQAIKRFKRYRLRARKFGKIEERVYQVYRNDLDRLLNKHVSLRSQTGLRDSFMQAIQRAKPYMSHMEAIFKQHRLPKELVRLTFVESMFNYKAKSKVGAAGVWQFMPATAREFMHLNTLVDERISPLKATNAAAKLLRRNHRKFNSYPLAITAYNQGAGNIGKAVRTLNTKNLDTIIRKYRGRSFGFAGRNFYSEFLAASMVYRILKDKPEVAHDPKPLALVALRLPKQVSVSRLIRKTSLDKGVLSKYNPCFNKKAFTSKSNANLPPYYEIYVPSRIATKVRNEVRNI
ncbi:MAG: lytic transglycosylase domain-containing protein [Pseudomonadota bacterium]|nr:lytic transglycosylase domain-containing protein [Pseudomonadota bacterium]